MTHIARLRPKTLVGWVVLTVVVIAVVAVALTLVITPGPTHP